VDVQFHVFLISELVGGEWSALLSDRLTPGNHWRGDWVGPQNRSGRHGEKNTLPLPGLEVLPLDHRARCQSLHRLRYPGSLSLKCKVKVKLSLSLIKHHAMNTCGGNGGEWSASRPCRVTPKETAPDTRCMEGWVCSQVNLDVMGRILLPPSWESNPDSPPIS
jgi:hypothetical protein